MNLGLFSCLLMMKRNNEYFEDIEDLSGLSKNHPLLSLSLLIILFSLAGIPPLAGFFSKVAILLSALSAGLWPYALCAVLLSVVSCFYYIRVVKALYFEAPERWVPYTAMSASHACILTVCTALTVVFVFYPAPLLKLCHMVALGFYM